MIKFWKFFEYAYLIIAILLLVEGFLKWSDQRQKAYFLFFFAAMAIFMYFFRKHYRKKFQNKDKSQ